MILLVERKELKQKKAQWMNKPHLFQVGFSFWSDFMRLVYLSGEFYRTYGNCPEIMKKNNRPYAALTIEVDGILFGIPFRHRISHKYAFITFQDFGLDYTKAVVIRGAKDISEEQPWINSKEWAIVKKNENKIRYDFSRYVKQYKRALCHRDNPRSIKLLQYSTLQYFQEYL